MWKQLTKDDLKIILSDDEMDTLQTTSTDSEDVAQQILDLVADQFRGALRMHGFKLDKREHYTPYAYWLKILQTSREIIWTRFPNSDTIAIDKLREQAAKSLDELLQKIYIAPDMPDADYAEDETSTSPGQLTLPFLRMDEMSWFFKARNKYF